MSKPAASRLRRSAGRSSVWVFVICGLAPPAYLTRIVFGLDLLIEVLLRSLLLW